MPVALCLPLKPRSLNAKPSAAYRETLARAARLSMASSLLSAPLYSRIIWFHKYDTKGQGDIDNIAKRIHDALKGIIFADDASITHALAIRVDATADYEILDDPGDPSRASILLKLMRAPEHRDILYIEIGPQTDPMTRLGPVQ